MPKEKKSKPSKKSQQTTLTGIITSPRKLSQSRPKTKARQKPTRINVDASDDESDLDAIKLVKPKNVQNDDSNRSPKVHKSRILDSDEDDDEENLANTKPSSSTRLKSRSNKDETTSKRLKPRRRPSPDSEDEQPPPRKRRGRLIKHIPSASDEDEEDDDLEPEHILDSRFRKRDKKTTFQKNLEKLKRRKQGKKEPESEESGSEEDGDSDEGEVGPFKGAKRDDDRDSLFDGSDEDGDSAGSSDFIVEDDGTGLAALPAEFSMDTHQDLAHQFKKIFQFFVHIAVQPPVERNEFMVEMLKKEEYFSVPLIVTRRKLSGLRDSLVASSVWHPKFKKQLETYPELDVIELDFAVPGCDACHLGSRTSTLCGRLLGHAYDHSGFEEVSDDESDADKDSAIIAEFHLGRFCARRVRVYHDLSHWEYNLFKTISDEMDELHMAAQDHGGGFVRVAYARGMKPPEDLQDADAICEWLDERKVIEIEWQKLKDVMERSRGLEFAAKKGETD
ncbi:hypothetical protein K435DRAFT_830337 [Dendrothele bispora CBS 962.96]|uniref:DUF4211 domain-containing protein n=1 Tax=Dendrothele bispora (strain CBS 962.96) TaxID=1314807 RepID=A0A4S8LJY5_DENBC|nr:hypothetical protein K435DRAFT_830337 [Dendrothele bispora CBS 962.96]